MGQVFRDLRTRGCTRAAPHVNEVTLDDVVPTLDGDGRHFQGMNDWSNRIDERALPDALRAILTEAIDTLPADYERPWSCTTSRGSMPDIAEILGVDMPGVKSRMHRRGGTSEAELGIGRCAEVIARRAM
jgi:hypothetical protein